MKFDVIIIGGGRSGMAKATELQKGGAQCAVICKGRSLYGFDPSEFQKNGGVLLMDEVISGEIVDGKVVALHTAKLSDEPLTADRYFLATGKFLAGGLTSDMNGVYEPLFGLDVKYEKDPEKWFSARFTDEQPFMKFGVVTDADGCALKNSEKIVNLFPIGEIIAE